MLIVDAHEDLAWNILTFDRDYTLAAVETRQREHGTSAPAHNGDTLLGYPDYLRGEVAVVFSTLFASPARRQQGKFDTQIYTTTEQANKVYRDQLDAYLRLTDDHPDKFHLIRKHADLDGILSHWQKPDADEHPIGLVILMENAEGVRSPSELEEWFELGVRIIGPAWAGTRFCGGTHEPGPLTSEGYDLLDGMADLGFVLDISHMDEQAALQALEYFPGVIIASHANAKSLLKDTDSNRFLSDDVIHALIERNGIIGIVPYNSFLDPSWRPSDGRQAVTLDHVVSHIDHVCQLAGSAQHVALGSDFDGGFGWQSVPAEIDSVADLQKLIPLLAEKGYTNNPISAIMGENWLSLLRRTLPEEE
jgi:membrane dipeptidase